MPCPDLGALRASIDDAPDGATATALHDHVHACASCSDTVAELQRNAELAAPAIALTAPEAPPEAAAVEAALARFERRPPPLPPGPTRRPRPSPWPGAAGRPGWAPGAARSRPRWSPRWC